MDPYKVDVLVVGSGAAGLTAAFTATQLGLHTMLIEQTDKIGGTTAYSGGTIWIPENSVSKEAGVDDRYEDACQYLMESLTANGGAGPESSPERIKAFLKHGPVMVDLLRSSGFRWRPSPIPDYHPEVEGARGGGRTLDPRPFDAAVLKERAGDLRHPEFSAPAGYFHDFCILTQPRASLPDFFRANWMRFRAWLRSKVMEKPTYMGCSLIAQLLAICLRKETQFQIRLNTRLKELVVRDRRVCGALAESDNRPIEVSARYGVVLATGGFARSATVREQHLPHTRVEWTLTQPEGDVGAALEAGRKVDAATSLMGEAWWIPTMTDPGSGRLTTALFELCKPHCIVVNKQGRRIFSEADPYGDSGRALYELCSKGNAAWLILDSTHRMRYTLGSLGPGAEPTDALGKKHMYRADTVQGLAHQIDVEAEGLALTVAKWNAMCEQGVDEEFRKGQSKYHLFIGDRRAKQPNMGPVTKAPFYAIAVRPGDAGTKGGLLTDESARVLDTKLSPIAGLYAAGNSSASVMGATSLGAGVTLGPAMTFAYIAVLHMLGARSG
ncbi:FAD binding domain-containing protein [Colletotrichum zoysiae]|uniref:FAD binding domain-containing protein n=1 Tax=Colletotrichum zoysiae TaxID=1216348 RepID=A0AAD9H3P0_9PEZI|nr:FAD binding domain-containing protein [Colletotrichum zoysiae]